MTHRIFPVLTCILASFAAHANAENCQELSKTLSAGWQQDVPCYCKSKELKRVRITLPKGLALQAVCALRGSDGKFINLARQSIDMDRYDSAGNSFYGEFYLSGVLSFPGSIQIEPGNSGDLWFTPAVGIADAASPFGGRFHEFKIVTESNYKKFRVTPAMLQSECLKAKASVEFDGFLISLGETDDAGAYPNKVKVFRVGQYRACK